LSKLAILQGPEAILDLMGQRISYPKTTTHRSIKKSITKRVVYLHYFGIWLEGLSLMRCNDPTIGSYNHYHLSPNGIPRGNQRWYGLVYFVQIAGKPRIRPRG